MDNAAADDRKDPRSGTGSRFVRRDATPELELVELMVITDLSIKCRIEVIASAASALDKDVDEVLLF